MKRAPLEVLGGPGAALFAARTLQDCTGPPGAGCVAARRPAGPPAGRYDGPADAIRLSKSHVFPRRSPHDPPPPPRAPRTLPRPEPRRTPWARWRCQTTCSTAPAPSGRCSTSRSAAGACRSKSSAPSATSSSPRPRRTSGLGTLPAEQADLIIRAAREVADGKLDEHFPVDIFQTGSGTSTNMNANEVIANRCSQLAGKAIGSKEPIHPNDDVNYGQSSNDTFPTAMHIAAARALQQRAAPALVKLSKSLSKKAKAVGHDREDRPHAPAGRHAHPPGPGVQRLRRGRSTRPSNGGPRPRSARRARHRRHRRGHGLNTHTRSAKLVCQGAEQATGCKFREAENHFEAQAAKDAFVEASGDLKHHRGQRCPRSPTTSAGWVRAALRHRRTVLPAMQPGSSIMPGKVNP